ncbi:MAG: hypothetical protein ACNYPD_04595 [Candidatus Halichondribacter symbioticus]
MACRTYGIDATNGDADCHDRPNIITTCTAENPFANNGCNDATHILASNSLLRINYCTAPLTTWNENCDTEGTYAGTKEARDLACRTYGIDATNGDADCHDRPNIITTCTATNPFANNGCNTATHILASNSLLRINYCTVGAKIFDPNCDSDAYGGVGVTTKARVDACTAGTARDIEGNTIADCGSETLAGRVFTYCATDAGLTDTDNCPVKAGGEIATNCRETNPWGTQSEPCTDATYVTYRATRCLNRDMEALPAAALINADAETLCAAVTTLTCEDGGGVDANPFAAICQVDSNPYDGARLGLCGGAIASLPSGVMPSACKLDDLSLRICGTADSTPGTNPFAPICSDGTAIVDGFEFAKAQKALVDGCDNKSITTGCNETVTAGGPTVAACIGDPYLTGCDGAAFTKVLMTRDGICKATGSDPFSSDCTNNPSKTTDQQSYCAGANTWRTACNIHQNVAGVMTARATACIADNAITTSNPGESAVMIAKPLFDNVCDGLQVDATNTVLSKRQMQCSDGTQSDDSLCNEGEITNVVCGSSPGTNVNPFASVCAVAIAGSLDTVQQTFCGGTARTATHSVNECNGILDGLCMGANSVKTGQGAAGYDCLGDSTTNVAAERVSFCETPATTYTTGCTTLIGEVLVVRKQLALDCVATGVSGTGCGQEVATGLTVATCSANPFLNACEVSGVIEAFNPVRSARKTLCTTAATSFDPLCNNLLSNPGETATLTFMGDLEIARGRGCLDSVQGATDCGAENDGSGDYVDVYCNAKGITDIANCPLNYASQNATTVTAVTVPGIGTGENQLLNSDGSDALTVIAANGADDTNDADANFIGITGGTALLASGAGHNNFNGLVLADTVSGFDFARSATNKLYVGLSEDTNLGAPLSDGAKNGDWAGMITVLTSAGRAQEVGFNLVVTFNAVGDNTLSIKETTLDVGSLGFISLNGKFTANGVIYGTVNFATAGAGTLSGLIGVNGAVGIFASDAGVNTDYVGGFVAAKAASVPSTCDTSIPFTHADCDPVVDAAARLAEANRCYNNGGVVATLGDCGAISACLARNASGLFSDETLVGALDNRVACSSPAFAGARANYCGGNNIAAELCKDFVALNNAEAACLTNPFTTGCGVSLGASVAMTARTARVDHCVVQAAASTTTTAVGNPCAGVLTYCSDTTRSETSECASSIGTNTALIPAFCGVFRNLSDAVCTDTTQRTDSCDGNPFYTFCTEPGYITAQRTACGADNYELQLRGFDGKRAQVQVADGQSPTVIDVAYCGTLSHTATLCADSGTNANPFAMICSDTIAAETLKTTQQGYCRGDGILEANPSDCGGVASTFCATAGTDNAVAFDNLCRDASYDEARVKACGAGTPNTSTYTVTGFTGCNDLVASLCPDSGSRNAGCPISGDTVTTASWTSVLSGAGAVQANGSTRLDILSELGLDEDYTGYVQADANGLKLGAALLDAGTRKTGVTYDGNILNLSDAGVAGNEGGVAFARIDFADFSLNGLNKGQRERYYAGILDGTDVGAPLNSAQQSGTWTGKIRLHSGSLRGQTDFSLTVVYSGTDNTLDGQITVDVGGFNVPFIVDGNFTNAGIIYGTTSLGDAGFLSTGSLTGLIGADGAVGAFVSSGAGGVINREGEYTGGFVVKASVPTPEPVTDCSATGTPFATGCADYSEQVKACLANNAAAMADFNANCRNNRQVTNRVCEISGTDSNVFNRAICPGAGNDIKRTTICVRRSHFGSVTGRSLANLGFASKAALAADCAGDGAITALVCNDLTSGQYARPFDTGICPNDGALRAKICNARVTVIVGGVPISSLPNGIDEITHCKNDPTVTAEVCIASGDNANPFDKVICPDSNDAYKAARAQACRDRADNPLPRGTDIATDCAGDTDVIARICTTDGSHTNPFDSLCSNEVGNLDTRISLCLGGGTDASCGTLIETNCPETGSRNPFCSARTDVASWARDAVGSNGKKGSLASDIIAAGGATHANTKDANFIVGGTSDLNLNAREYARLYGNIEEDGQTLSEFDGIADDKSGFSIQAAFFESTAGCRGRGDCEDYTLRSFVGLLSGTNLGAPLSSNEQSGTWDAKLSLLVGGGSAFVETGFKLKVDFDAKSIQIVDGSDVETVLSLTHRQFTNATLAITNGKFTANGIIHGTTNLNALGDTTRAGTLTGLIGEKGAVGIFASNANEGIAYVGGFVAAPDCKAAAGNPFSIACTDNLAQQKIFVNGCDDTSITDGCDQSVTGVADGTTINECIANLYLADCGGRTGAFADLRIALDATCGATGSNPFDNTCADNPNRIADQQRFCGNARTTDGSQKETDCDVLLTGLCAGSYSIVTRVGAGNYNCSADDEFSNDRELACTILYPSGGPVCETVITDLCTGANAFESSVGVNQFSCSGNSAVDGLRDAYCRTADFGDNLCDSGRIARICLAGDSPFSEICGADDGSTHAVERGKACAAGATDSSCGSETSAGDSYLKTYCATSAGNTNAAYCPVKYAGAVVDDNSSEVVVNDLTGKALNAEGTALLTGADGNVNTAIIGSGGASDADADTNFIAGDTAALNLGSGTTTNDATLTLTGNDTSGFALATGEFAGGNNLYVGLLAGTNLGAPLTDSSVDGVWTATVRVIEGDTLQDETEVLTTVQVLRQGKLVDKQVQFTLSVNFANKTIETNSTAPVIGTLGTIGINGKFTVNGLIYGTVDFGGPTNTATLTGLIGTTGAVGIFASNSAASTAYVGGFVARRTVDCSNATGNPFHADCTDNNEEKARHCLGKDGKSAPTLGSFANRCNQNAAVTNIVCQVNGENADLFSNVCLHRNGKKAELCGARNSGLFDVPDPAGFETACKGAYQVRDRICVTSGKYANPFDTGICGTDQAKQRTFLTNCQASVGVPSKTAPSRGANCTEYANCVSNPFDTAVCPDAGDTVRAQACIARDLARGVTLADDCADDPAITALICATSGALANPFDTGICEGDQDSTQETFLANCKAGNANGADCSVNDDCIAYPYGTRCDATVYGQERTDYTTLVDGCRKGTTTGDACNAYTACVENPYQATCYAVLYAKERSNYANQFVESCLGVDGVDAPVGAPDSCTDALAQATICASSGEYANPFHATICAGYDDLATIQSEFATMCYNAQADSRTIPECSTIATCFESGNLGLGTAMTSDGIACNNVAFNDAVTLNTALVACDGQVSGVAVTGTCAQETVTKACNANPFSVIVASKGIDCLSDTALNDRREAVCINDDTNPAFNCSLTTTRVCETDNNPFSDLCYDNSSYEQARYETCNGISGDITPTARTNNDTTIQNCLDTIDYECEIDAGEQFTNRFCKIGTLYHAERGRSCLYGYQVLGADKKTITNVDAPAECSSNTTYIPAFCNENPFDAHNTCASNTAYDAARGRECLAGYTDAGGMTPALCGDEDGTGGATYVKAYCASNDSGVATNIKDCPNGYARLNGTAVTEVTVPAIGTGENQLLNSDGSAALTIIAADGANDVNDAPTNFIGITGGSAILASGTNRNGLVVADTVSGFAFAESATNKLYVGFSEDTSLGAPLSSGTATSATWDATVSVLSFDGAAIGTPANKTFKLLVSYGGTSENTLAVMGTNPSVGSLGAFTIDGKFTRNGVIYGTVNFATNAGTGTLTGLIGDAGVVGIFKSDAETVATASSIAYVGGFTAEAPAAPDSFPKYSSFVEHYGSRLNADLTTGGRYAFLEGTETGLNMTGLATSDITSAIKLGGDAAKADSVDGFSIIRVATARENPAVRAGLLSGTDLGAVLDNPASITWNGSIHLLANLLNSTRDDLTLTVDFAAGTIVATSVTIGTGGFGTTGTVAINGRFGSLHNLPDGILGGDVVHNSGTSLPLIGLIGEEGVIGVFHSSSFVGGFQATPTPASVNFADWEASFETGGVNSSQTLQNKGFVGGFGARNYVKLDANGNVLENSTIINTTILRLNGATSQGDDGYDSGFAYAKGAFTVYAGLLSTTNVGPAIENTDLNGTWNGSLGGLANNGNLTLSSTSFNLRVNFDAGTKQGTITTFGFNPNVFEPTTISGRRFSVNGNFNADGVMWGDVGLGGSSGTPPVNGVFSGLIGQNGAVGVFKGSDGGGYAGGFQAKKSN